MASAWRYYTTPDCIRHWHLFRHVGPAEIVRAALPACTRAGALALPLLAAPAAVPVPVPARVLPAPLPWIGQPDAFGGGAYALGGPGYGFGEAGYAPFSEFAPLPAGSALVGAVSNRGGRHVTASDQLTFGAGAGAAASAPFSPISPALASTPDTAPRPVPEPASVAILAVAMGAVVVLRGRA